LLSWCQRLYGTDLADGTYSNKTKGTNCDIAIAANTRGITEIVFR